MIFTGESFVSILLLLQVDIEVQEIVFCTFISRMIFGEIFNYAVFTRTSSSHFYIVYKLFSCFLSVDGNVVILDTLIIQQVYLHLLLSKL